MNQNIGRNGQIGREKLNWKWNPVMDKILKLPNNRKFNPNSYDSITQVMDQMNQIIGRNDPNWTRKKSELEMKPSYRQNSKITQSIGNSTQIHIFQSPKYWTKWTKILVEMTQIGLLYEQLLPFNGIIESKFVYLICLNGLPNAPKYLANIISSNIFINFGRN